MDPTKRSQSFKFKNNAKPLEFGKKKLNTPHIFYSCLSVANIVEDTQQTQFCPQTERRIDRQRDGQGETIINFE